ncbi:MAG TPA: hypothetical protein VMT52_08885 [Planctomycetota bacterium]|nr:hypothetical protein [Planctomycetota bacterium]
MNEVTRSTTVILLFFALPLAGAETLGSARKDARCTEYDPPGAEELRNAEKLFAAAFSPATEISALTRLARGIDLEILPIVREDDEIIVLREAPHALRGRGFFAFRRKDARPLALQAPHSWEDLHTGLIAEMLFLESHAAASAWNTAPRSTAVKGENRLADLAHLPDSLLHAFTRAFASAYPRGTLLQIHGFDAGKRATREGSGSAVILSDGTKSPPIWVLDAAECLEVALSERVSVYPRHVKELGATTNTQGKVFQEIGHAGFLHVEMDLELRRRLKETEKLRNAFLQCMPDIRK